MNTTPSEITLAVVPVLETEPMRLLARPGKTEASLLRAAWVLADMAQHSGTLSRRRRHAYPNTGLPIAVNAKIIFKDPDIASQRAGYVSVDELLAVAIARLMRRGTTHG